MCDSLRRFAIAVLTLTLLQFASTPAIAGEPSETRINGTLSEIDGVRILRVWGTPKERGFAHGFLLGQDSVRVFNGFLSSGAVVDAETYEKRLLPGLQAMQIQPQYEAELRAMLAGIESQAGGPVELPALKRHIKYEDLVVANCMGDILRGGCSSFTAWGSMTKDGQTITGRNMDWHTCPAFEGTQLVMVHIPAREGALGWVSVFWPGLIGCTTGMNAEGVTVAMHDSNSEGPSTAAGFTSSTLLYREAIESAHANTAVEDISRIFAKRYTRPGYNMMVTWPYASGGPAAIVFEHDADLTNGRGMTIRKPESSDTFLACTNHSRERYPPDSGFRYPQLVRVLERIRGSDGSHQVTLKRAWGMLRGVSIPGILTHHSVVFEPNKKLMHVAFAEDGKHAPQCRHVTLDVEKLLAGDYPGGTRP
jgi:hypothetical protein